MLAVSIGVSVKLAGASMCAMSNVEAHASADFSDYISSLSAVIEKQYSLFVSKPSAK